MAPNPVVIPRQQSSSESRGPRGQGGHYISGRALSLLSIIVTIAAAGTVSRQWGRSWVTSGAAPTTILLCLLSYSRSLALQDNYTWILLAALNIAFVIASTSWLLFPFFVATAYTTTFWICVLVFPAASSAYRRLLRVLCPGIYFFQDKIALFNIPALQIDTKVNGLFVVRGLTFSLLDLTLEARGIELGLRLNNDVELAMCADRLTVRLFRQILVTDVYGNLKVNERGMYFESPENSGTRSLEMSERRENGIMINLAQSSIAKPVEGAPEEQQRSTNRTGTDATKTGRLDKSTKSNDDKESEASYRDFLTDVEHSSQIYIARHQIENAETSKQPGNEREMRQAVCAKLQEVPTVSHTPEYAVKVSVLQTIFPRLRRFLHRLPLLLRLLLNPLSTFHPIDIASVSVAGPGEKLKEFLENYVSKIMTQEAQDADMEQFQEEMSQWLAGATFCLEAADISALAHVPLSSASEITTYLRSGNVSMYRTPLDSNTVTQVTHIGGADATAVIPAYLLPHHEHCLPPKSTGSEPGRNDSMDASQGGYRSDTDQAEMTVSVHASLPTHFDQSLLDFAAVLLKATKLIDLENLFERDPTSKNLSDEQQDSTVSVDRPGSQGEHDKTNLDDVGDNDQQSSDSKKPDSNLSKRLASRAYHSVKDGVKKGTMINVATNKINDRWVMRTVSRIAERLEHAQGDFGYTTNIPLDLESYREAAESPSKILP